MTRMLQCMKRNSSHSRVMLGCGHVLGSSVNDSISCCCCW
jgi:hypothetical protein